MVAVFDHRASRAVGVEEHSQLLATASDALTQVCPEWIRVRPSDSPRFREVERVLREQGLHIVGEPDAKDDAIWLQAPMEAGRFQRRLVNACIRAHAQAEPLCPEQLQVAIIDASNRRPSGT